MSSFVLTYHSLDDSGSVISIAPAVFRRQMLALARSGVRVVPLREAGRAPNTVSITFDDGFANFHRFGLPVLAECGFPATVFAVSGFCGRRNNWPSQSAGIPVMDLMTWEQLGEAARSGIEIGAHTVTHPRLGLLAPSEAEREISRSRTEIEQRLGLPVLHFSYPYGDCRGHARAIAQQSFEKSFTTELRTLEKRDDPAVLPRIDAYYLQKPFWFNRLTSWDTSAYLAARRIPRKVRELLQPCAIGS